MKAAPLIFLLASVCPFHAGADLSAVPVFQNIDIQKLAGKWYPVANTVETTQSKNSVPFENSLEPCNAEDMLFKMRRIKNGRCEIVEALVQHTSEPGIYTIPLTQETVRFMHVEYESFFMVHITRNDVYNLYLESKTRRPSRKVKRKFRKLARTLGFDVNRITYANLADSCP
ncbi:epididymal secretory protein 4-like isoform X2 [Paroedura picta]|uniref:epididymal secretory protein 4-like isoform X2 n=1 Tax=Paroedura picta TaxID=143630 RepID=UPI00405638F5